MVGPNVRYLIKFIPIIETFKVFVFFVTFSYKFSRVTIYNLGN